MEGHLSRSRVVQFFGVEGDEMTIFSFFLFNKMEEKRLVQYILLYA